MVPAHSHAEGAALVVPRCSVLEDFDRNNSVEFPYGTGLLIAHYLHFVLVGEESVVTEAPCFPVCRAGLAA